MLTIFSQQRNAAFCNRQSRRDFLRIGGLAMGGLALPQLLRAEALSGKQSHKSVIMIFLPGGPPHQDTFDLKPEAPVEVRGEFKPIRTNVPGIEICELLPKIAGMMDKLVPIRSVVGSEGAHASFQCMTGHRSKPQPPGGWPELGSYIAKIKGAAEPAVPPFVGLSTSMVNKPFDSGKPGYLGPAYSPFLPNGQGRDDLVLHDISLERLSDRHQLNRSLDRFRSNFDSSGTMDGFDVFQQQAMGVLTSNKLADALDLNKESPELRARYGKGPVANRGAGGPQNPELFLTARRLVEAGVRCVTLSFSAWDFHGKNFDGCRATLPVLDQGVAALVADLHHRGLDKDVAVCVWGEFGRTPKINRDAGRDHWPNVSCALLAGGGFRTGQVIGATDRTASEAKDRPVHFQEVFATLYHAVGIDTEQTTLPDLAGRPQYLTDHREPIHELF